MRRSKNIRHNRPPLDPVERLGAENRRLNARPAGAPRLDVEIPQRDRFLSRARRIPDGARRAMQVHC